MQKVFQSRLLTSAPGFRERMEALALRGRGRGRTPPISRSCASSRSPTWRGCSTCSTPSTRRSWKPRPGAGRCRDDLRAGSAARVPGRELSRLCTDPFAPTCPSAGRRRRSGGGAGGADGAEGPAAGGQFPALRARRWSTSRNAARGPRRSDPCHHRQPVEPAGQACRPVVRGAGAGSSTSRARSPPRCAWPRHWWSAWPMRWPPTARHSPEAAAPGQSRCWPRCSGRTRTSLPVMAADGRPGMWGVDRRVSRRSARPTTPHRLAGLERLQAPGVGPRSSGPPCRHSNPTDGRGPSGHGGKGKFVESPRQ